MVGRPRKCSIEDRLDLAMEVFWRQGFEATSMGDLSRALGVGSSSLYNDFGSKEALFERCVERYNAQNGAFIRDALTRPDTLEALTEVLQAAAREYTRPTCPRGCAVIAAGRLHHPDQKTLDALLLNLRLGVLARIEARVQAGVEAGDLKTGTDVPALARLVTGQLQGLSAQARDGADEAALTAVAQQMATMLRLAYAA